MTILSVREWRQLLSPADYEVRVLFDIKLKARDGVLLSNDIYLPRAPGPFPTIVTRTPYENSAENNMNWGIFYAQHGYAAVLQDTRGRYDSDGDFYPWRTDPDDGDDTFEWVANQAWCNGKIGTWGRSYGGAHVSHPGARLVRHAAGALAGGCQLALTVGGAGAILAVATW